MVSKEFKNNIESKNIISVRSALVDYLIIDTTFLKFDEALEESKKTLNVLEAYDGEPFEDNSNKWDKNYLNRQKVALMNNFSEIRIDHLKKVIKKVIGENIIPSESSETKTLKKVTGRLVVSETELEIPGQNNITPSGAKQINKNTKPKNKTTKKREAQTDSENISHIKKKSDDAKIGSEMVKGGLITVAVGGLAAISGAGSVSYAIMAVGAGVVGVGVYKKNRK